MRKEIFQKTKGAKAIAIATKKATWTNKVVTIGEVEVWRFECYTIIHHNHSLHYNSSKVFVTSLYYTTICRSNIQQPHNKLL
jgi:hypothetical protein